MQPPFRSSGALMLAGLLLAATGLAQAQTHTRSVAVLGIRSLDGDDDIALAATEALRATAGEVSVWQVSDHSMSLSQMMLAHGCDEPDEACLGQIAGGLQVQLVIYGSLSRTSDAYGPLELTVSLFDANAGALSGTTAATFPRTDGDEAGMAPHASEIVAALAPQPSAHGTLQVNVNVATAEVYVDGTLASVAQDGVLELPNVEPGVHQVEVRAVDHTPFVTQAEIAADSVTTVDAQLTPAMAVQASATTRIDDSGGSLPPWLGYALLGAAGASVIGAISSAIVVNNIENDELFLDYKDAVSEGNTRALRRGGDVYEDACVAADAGLPYGLSNADVEDVADMCVAGSTAEVLQWVFIATAVVAGGAGAYLLLSEDDDEGERQSQPTLSLQPSFDAQSARLSATLRL